MRKPASAVQPDTLRTSIFCKSQGSLSPAAYLAKNGAVQKRTAASRKLLAATAAFCLHHLSLSENASASPFVQTQHAGKLDDIDASGLAEPTTPARDSCGNTLLRDANASHGRPQGCIPEDSGASMENAGHVEDVPLCEASSEHPAASKGWLSRIFSTANKRCRGEGKGKQDGMPQALANSSLSLPVMPPLLQPADPKVNEDEHECMSQKPHVSIRTESTDEISFSRAGPPTMNTSSSPSTDARDTAGSTIISAHHNSHGGGISPSHPDVASIAKEQAAGAATALPSLEGSFGPVMAKMVDSQQSQERGPFRALQFGSVAMTSFNFIKSRKSFENRETDTGDAVTARRSDADGLVPRLDLSESPAPTESSRPEPSGDRSERLPPLSNRENASGSPAKTSPAVPRLKISLSIRQPQISDQASINCSDDDTDDADIANQSELDVPFTSRPPHARSKSLLSTPTNMPTPRSLHAPRAETFSPRPTGLSSRIQPDISHFDVVPQGPNLSRSSSFVSGSRDDASWCDHFFSRSTAGVQSSSGSLTGCALRDRMVKEQLTGRGSVVKFPPRGQAGAAPASGRPAINVHADAYQPESKGLFSFLHRNNSKCAVKPGEAGVFGGAWQRIGSAFSQTLKEARDGMLRDLQQDSSANVTNRFGADRAKNTEPGMRGPLQSNQLKPSKQE